MTGPRPSPRPRNGLSAPQEMALVYAGWIGGTVETLQPPGARRGVDEPDPGTCRHPSWDGLPYDEPEQPALLCTKPADPSAHGAGHTYMTPAELCWELIDGGPHDGGRCTLPSGHTTGHYPVPFSYTDEEAP